MKRKTQAERDAELKAIHEDNVADLADSAEQWGADLSRLSDADQDAVRRARGARDGRR